MRLFRRATWCLALVAAALFCCVTRAQVVITSAADTTDLQNALLTGATNILLQFDGTMNPIGVFEIITNYSGTSVTIDATGYSVVIGGTSNQCFYVDPGAHFTLINVTLSGAYNVGTAGTAGVNGTGMSGNGNGNSGTAGGAGSNMLGGAVYNAGNSTFINCLFYTNTVIGGAGAVGGSGANGNNKGGAGGNGGAGGAGLGGGIYNVGTLLLSNCTFAGNIAMGGAGAAGGTNGSGALAGYPGAGGVGGAGSGAGIYNAGVATIVNSTINQNLGQSGVSSTSGGGQPQSNGNGANGQNGANSEGGGVYNSGTNYFLNCTFFANEVIGGTGCNGGPSSSSGFDGGNGGNGGTGYGGSIFNDVNGLITVTNCTFSGGTVIGGTNGVGGSGTENSGNSGSPGSALGANIANYSGNSAAKFLFKNSILDFPTNATSAYGSITDQGNNLSSDTTPAFTTTNSFNNKDPKLSPSGLQPNLSTVVLTIALSANSPAIDAIYDGSAPPFDERGFIRPVGPRPDIGAFEYLSYTATYNVSGQVIMGTNPFPGVVVSAGLSTSTTDSNGNFALTLPVSNNVSIRPNPLGYFNPSASNIYVVGDVTGLLFKATNATGTITNTSGASTNTNSYNLTFTGIPGFNYIIQAATNLSTNSIVWTNLITNVAATNGVFSFNYTLTGTNITNYPKQFFRAVPPP